MKKLLIFLTTFTACQQKPDIHKCQFSFAVEVIKGVEYQECKIKDLY